MGYKKLLDFCAKICYDGASWRDKLPTQGASRRTVCISSDKTGGNAWVL